MPRTISAARAATLVGDFPRSPAYVGLAERLRVAIGDGRIDVGVRLPSERALSTALGVSRTTVTRAYELLRDAGYAEARRGAGTFTRVPGGRSRAHDRSLLPGTSTADTIDLNCAAPSAPPGIADAYRRAAEQLPAYLSGPGYFPLGVPALQAALAQRYTDDGLPTVPEQIMITPGALAAAAVVAQAFTGPGERVAVESPTYPNATRAIRHAGARLVPAAVDPDGWDLDSFGATLAQTSPRLTYVIPDFQNPTGHLMTAEDRVRLTEHAQRARTRLVCDEAHRALALDPGLVDAMPPPLATFADSTITLGSASKSHWGGLRLGWVRTPLSEMPRLLDARIGLDLGAPVFEQLVLVDLLEQGDTILSGNRQRLRGQRDALVAAVGDALPDWRFRVPKGGLALWCELPEPLGTATCAAAERQGLLVPPGPVFAVNGGHDAFVRIPWTAGEDVLTTAVGRLASAWDSVLAGRSDTPPSRHRVLVA